jgi:hypothetical protein
MTYFVAVHLNFRGLPRGSPVKVKLRYLAHQSGPGYCSPPSDSLRAGLSRDRIPVGERYSAPVQNGPGAHPASYTPDTGSFPGSKRAGRGSDQPPPSSSEVKERVALYLYFPSGPS